MEKAIMKKRPKQTNCQQEPAYPDHDTEVFLFRYPHNFPVTFIYPGSSSCKKPFLVKPGAKRRANSY